MDLWNTFEAAKAKPDFSKERLQIRVRNRIDTSLDKIDYSNYDIQLAEASARTFSDETRYLSASNVCFELVVSIYEVNTRTMAVVRPASPLQQEDLKRLKTMVWKGSAPNIEVRIIGLQSGANNVSQALLDIDHIRKTVGGNLMEVDLFGNNARHLAFDTRTGLSYDLLLQNKVYGPHELVNSSPETEFKARESKLKFV